MNLVGRFWVRFLNPESGDLSLTFYSRVIDGLIFGVVHPEAISIFIGPKDDLFSKTGLHRCWKTALEFVKK
jgi:hypothetical protein